MSSVTLGNLAATYKFQRQTAEIKSSMTRLSTELSTGLKVDLGKAVGHDFGPFAGIERSLATIASYTTVNTEAATMLGSAQMALENIQNMTSDLAPALLTAASATDVTLIKATAADAGQKFESMVASLNTRIGNRSLFGGAATDRSPLASAETMMAELRTLAAGETTAAGVEAVVEAWFDDAGGGFETIGYLGSDANLGPFLIAEDEAVEVTVKANDQALRDTMKAYAMTGLIAEGILSGNADEMAALIGIASGRMIAADGDMTDLRAQIGSTEARVEDAQARNSAEKTAYELARNDMISADPYQTASELEATYSQLELLYTVTAKILNLRFSDYVR